MPYNKWTNQNKIKLFLDILRRKIRPLCGQLTHLSQLKMGRRKRDKIVDIGLAGIQGTKAKVIAEDEKTKKKELKQKFF